MYDVDDYDSDSNSVKLFILFFLYKYEKLSSLIMKSDISNILTIIINREKLILSSCNGRRLELARARQLGQKDHNASRRLARSSTVPIYLHP
jgi:hypothetical protein